MLFEIEGKQYYMENDQNINCIMLYGSWARHENDEFSDMDILIVTETTTNKKFVILDSEGKILPEKWVSVYCKEDIAYMKKNTSLFLWHIKLEALCLYKKDLFMDKILNNLTEYRGTAEDIYQYKVICQDIKELMEKQQFISLFYELSLLASLVRNIAIAYCYVNGKKCFGRIKPVFLLTEDYPLFSIEEYMELYKFRSLYNNSEKNYYGKIELEFIWKWIDIIEELIEVMEDSYV